MSIANWKGLPSPWGWGNQPHPSCVLQIHLTNIKHIVEKHLTNKAEPWSEWAGPDTVEKLVRIWLGRAADERWYGPAKQLTKAMKPEVDSAYRAPLAITVAERPVHETPTGWAPTSEKRVPKCILALPNGAMMVVESALRRSSDNILLTCYFPNYVCWGDATTRGKRLARALLLRFCKELSGELYMHPEPADTFIKKEEECLQDEVEFVTRQSWGFECERQPIGTEVAWTSHGHPPAVRPRLVSRTHTIQSEQRHVCR